MKRPEWMQERLIVSSASAEALCLSSTAWGPDFIGADGKFCDMETKALSSVCGSESVTGDCVEFDQEKKQIRKRSRIAGRAAAGQHKSYSSVETWG